MSRTMSHKGEIMMDATDKIEREIVECLRAAGLRLRHDKSATRLIDDLKVVLGAISLKRQCVIFTVTAPIRRRAKTTATMERIMRDGLSDEVCDTVHGNQIQIRRVSSISEIMPRALGFVHNPASDVALIFSLAEAQLRKPNNMEK